MGFTLQLDFNQKEEYLNSMKHSLSIVLIISALLFSCTKKDEVVSWTSLSELDEISIAVEHAAAEHQHDEQKVLLKRAGKLISEVQTSVPDNAKNTEQVAVLVKDLSALSTQIDSIDTLGHEELDTLSKAIHPIVAKLMETAGVPHVHAKEESAHDGHDHHDHDHDH